MIYIAILDIDDNKYQCQILGEEGSILARVEIPEGEFETWLKNQILVNC